MDVRTLRRQPIGQRSAATAPAAVPRCRARAAPLPLALRQRCGATAAGTAQPRSELLASRARQLYEVAWSEGRVRLLDEIMAEEHRQIDVIWQPDNTGGGRRRLKRGILAYRAAYPDIKFTVEDVAVAEGSNKAFVSWSAAGTNLGPIREQPPSGRRVAFKGVTLVTFDAEGLIQECAVYRQAPEDEARRRRRRRVNGGRRPCPHVAGVAAGALVTTSLKPNPHPFWGETSLCDACSCLAGGSFLRLISPAFFRITAGPQPLFSFAACHRSN
ncbi:MAG: hypothetical protein J3K34DRAFT_159854 [Monoraphidium minutum]|nr:MAG: hypothetical protein J3K34DRAFT_159854 [Monoraphidium minutum]